MSTKKVTIHEFLEHYSRKIVKIAIPVIVTLILDAILTRFLENTSGSVNLDRSIAETMAYNDGGYDFSDSLYLALYLIFMILLVTALLVTLYFCGCVKIIFWWMVFSTTLLLSLYMWVCLGSFPTITNKPVDWISFGLVVGGLVIVGNMSLFWRGPPIVTQFFMIFISVLVALVFLNFPDWSIWMLLTLLVFYDMFVVLCPGGLLKILIEKSKERGDSIPALIYSSVVFLMATEETNNYQAIENPKAEEEEDTGIKLGLGDFCFYGVLVTRAARLGWDIVVLCVFAVILGLSLTLLCLAIYERPLPALPFSLVLGILFFIIGAFSFRSFNINLRNLRLVL